MDKMGETWKKQNPHIEKVMNNACRKIYTGRDGLPLEEGNGERSVKRVIKYSRKHKIPIIRLSFHKLISTFATP